MSLKHSVRDAWLSASYTTGISQLYNQLAGRKRGIISYHNVLPINTLPPFDTYNVDVTARVFEQQLDFLTAKFRLRPIEELTQNDRQEGFFLTVDDGMLNNYTTLAPILAKYNLTALFAICPAMVDAERSYIWRDHLFLLCKQALHQHVWLPTNNYESRIKIEDINATTRSLKKYIYDHQIADVYKLVDEICLRNGWSNQKIPAADTLRYDFMNWEQINALIAQGHRMASHTMTHRVMKFLSLAEKQRELIDSKKRLESRTNTTVDTLVYPYGGMEQIDVETLQVAIEAGYKNALMNVQHHNLTPVSHGLPRFALPPIADSAHLYAIMTGYKFLNKKMMPF